MSLRRDRGSPGGVLVTGAARSSNLGALVPARLVSLGALLREFGRERAEVFGLAHVPHGFGMMKLQDDLWEELVRGHVGVPLARAFQHGRRQQHLAVHQELVVAVAHVREEHDAVRDVEPEDVGLRSLVHVNLETLGDVDVDGSPRDELLHRRRCPRDHDDGLDVAPVVTP